MPTTSARIGTPDSNTYADRATAEVGYAVASNFEEAGAVRRRFWTGVTNHGFGGAVPETTANPDHALLMAKYADADGAAVALTELARELPPRDGRTWFVAEFRAAIKRRAA